MNSAKDANNKKSFKYVKVECPGFVNTIFKSETSECSLIMGNGSFIHCDPVKMAYSFVNSSGEQLEIKQNNTIVYMPNDFSESLENSYVFDMNSDIILTHKDENANKFTVNRFGKATVLSRDTTDDSSQNDRDETKIRTYRNHAPKFFVIHKDSSGTELLRYSDIMAYLNEAEIDPMTAVIRDNVQGYPNIISTTVLKPLKGK
jgi:hypothetical protein